ncbi:hypothetical protein ACFSNB_15770 [Phaeospirillum tilakii]|uniref:Uncharacterized protein n=2 Tax=Phaeospirillum tilakii TaxID=741673 RepID=A0ABW5CG98_9PROT
MNRRGYLDINIKNLHKYRFLSGFFFKKDFHEDGSCVTFARIVISESASPGSNFLELNAFDVIEIVIGNLNKSTGVFVKIDDISNRMIEGGIFEISDIESNQFRIICGFFDFKESVMAQ